MPAAVAVTDCAMLPERVAAMSRLCPTLPGIVNRFRDLAIGKPDPRRREIHLTWTRRHLRRSAGGRAAATGRPLEQGKAMREILPVLAGVLAMTAGVAGAAASGAAPL